jgi:hypothetical protein
MGGLHFGSAPCPPTQAVTLEPLAHMPRGLSGLRFTSVVATTGTAFPSFAPRLDRRERTAYRLLA